MQSTRLFRVLELFFALIMLFPLTACDLPSDRPKQKSTLPSPSWPRGDFPGNPSSALEAEIFIDASTSMKGYVPPAQNTDYLEVIRVMESAIRTGWDAPQVNFFKFGSEVQKLKGRDYLQCSFPKFYMDPSLSMETNLQKVINNRLNERENLLTVIVTDLYQEDADSSLLVRLIQQNCFERGLTVGFAGIRSFFSGRIYDVGLNSESFSFKSQPGKENSYRPFYLITIGKYPDVQQFFKKLTQNSKSLKRDNVVVFSPHLTSPLLTFTSSQRGKETRNVNWLNDIVPEDPRVKQFRVLDDDAPVIISYSIPYVLANYSPTLDSPSFTPEVTVLEFNNGGQASLIKPLGNVSAGAVLKKGTLGLTFEIAPKALKEGARYQVQIIIRPGEDAYRLPDFIEAWDLPLLRKIHVESDKQLMAIGSKTQSLAFFMKNLLQANYRVHKPKLFDSYIYLAY